MKPIPSLGEDKVASMVLSRIQKNWAEKTKSSTGSSRRAAGTGKSEPKIAGDFPIWLKAIIYLVIGATVLYAVGAFGYYNFFGA